MAANDATQKTGLLGLDAYSPAEIQDKVEKLGVKKVRLPFVASFMLSVVAGGSIGLGGMFFVIILADPTLGFAFQRLLGGIVFSLGLALVVIGGAELFTGNCLIVMAWANRQISTREVLGNWTTVWLGNLVGALGLVAMIFLAHHTDMNNGLVGAAVLKLALSKIAPDMVTIFFKGVLCNILVCLGVWLAYAGRSVADKMAGLILPVAAFVAAGFEHCVANMYFLPLAWLLAATGHVPADLDVSAITLTGILHNLIPATLGNIVGGAGCVGFVYWAIYRRALGGLTPLDTAAPAAADGDPARRRAS
ncbi:formate/nitrite transporter family protein [Siculibacillus lacustris]|uniref:Formate/nitrite transporter family protein n=1 Tax=Siculibacillus lacustris TaxID=1549641 RepID=A0A4Q9VFA8_9HYPH|nr:formate/nitrite transporter family protein [Siculibacillus lacustris]TBW33575.1 formate/nitrite transporter family protein [Siculibacillus lacustris]